MVFQPIVMFAAVAWALAFAAFGLYLLFRRSGVPVGERLLGLVVSLLVGGVGAAVMVGSMYLVEELL